MRPFPGCLVGIFGAITLLLPATSLAQEDALMVEGAIFDEAYRRLADITVTATNTETGAKQVAKSDARGYFRLGWLQVGMYRLEATTSDGEVLLDENYSVGEDAAGGSSGDVEQIVILVGTGIHRLGLSSSAAGDTPARVSRAARRTFSGAGGGWTGNANGLIGIRSLDDDFWGPVDHPLAAGIDVDFGKDRWPVHIAIGFHTSRDEKRGNACFLIPFCDDPGPLESEGTIDELDVGAVKTFAPGDLVRPFVGAGIAFLDAERDERKIGVRDDDQAQGFFVRGGIYWTVEQGGRLRANLGFEIKVLSGADIELFGVRGDADYFQVAGLSGLGW